MQARARAGCWKHLAALHFAVRLAYDDLARIDVPHETRADEVERAGLRREDRRAVEIAEDERADPDGVARADKPLRESAR